MAKSKDDLWADVVADRELRIKKKTKYCVTCGKKLRKDRADYLTKWCCTACRLEESNTND